MKTIIIRFGLLAAAVLVLLALSRFALFYRKGFWELVIALSAILLLGLGYVLATYLRKPQVPKSTQLANPTAASINHQKLEELGITKREYEVLKCIVEGLSNKEIGQQLFISESTVKSHVSNILSKMGAQRRTQASKLAKDWKLII